MAARFLRDEILLAHSLQYDGAPLLCLLYRYLPSSTITHWLATEIPTWQVVHGLTGWLAPLVPQ